MPLGKGSCSAFVLIGADCSMATEHVKYILEHENFAALQVDLFFFSPLILLLENELSRCKI